MVRRLAMVAALAALATGCSAQASRPAARPSAPARDPGTAAALLKIAGAFNDEYDGGDYGPVWDRWDARSQAVIARADYVWWHTECRTSPQSAQGGGRPSGAGRGVCRGL